ATGMAALVILQRGLVDAQRRRRPRACGLRIESGAEGVLDFDEDTIETGKRSGFHAWVSNWRASKASGCSTAIMAPRWRRPLPRKIRQPMLVVNSRSADCRPN